MMNDPIFGRIEFSTNPRAKRINIRILADSLLVKMPPGCTVDDAKKMIERERDVILKKQKLVKERQKDSPVFITAEKGLKTLTFEVELKKVKRENVHFQLKDDKLFVECPDFADTNDMNTQSVLWNGVNYFMKKDARRILPPRLETLAKAFNFTYSDVKIQSSKGRWGSCSSTKSINLSFYLLLLPPHLIDYVILHELCHTKEMNHSEHFWRWMDKVTDGKSDALNKELKKYSIPKF